MVITRLTRNQLYREVPWVRIPPSPPQINPDKHWVFQMSIGVLLFAGWNGIGEILVYFYISFSRYGLQTLQGRYPASTASSRVSK